MLQFYTLLQFEQYVCLCHCVIDKAATNGGCSVDVLKSNEFLNTRAINPVVHEKGFIYGITVLNSELFVVRGSSQGEVKVYNSSNLRSIRTLTVPGSKRLQRIVACPSSNCLYISDARLEIIYRFDVGTNIVICSWSVGGACRGLSLTSSHSILATFVETRHVREYTQDGSLIREIRLDDSIERPLHCIQLSIDQFIVCHEGIQQRVCIVDTNGRVVKSYGGPQGSGVEQMHGPSCLAVDSHKCVFIADYFNNRVELLSPTLTHLGYIDIPGYQLNNPYTLYLDELNHRLCIGEWESGGRLVVLNAVGDNFELMSMGVNRTVQGRCSRTIYRFY